MNEIYAIREISTELYAVRNIFVGRNTMTNDSFLHVIVYISNKLSL